MSAVDFAVRILADAFDPNAEARDFAERRRASGAIVTFLGQARAENGRVEQLTLEHYPGFTEERICAFVDEARRRWPLDGVRIVHRAGVVRPREPIVFVAAAAAHRRAAFDAVDFLMDRLKTEAPFWKKEIMDGNERWIEPRAEDHADKARWAAEPAEQ